MVEKINHYPRLNEVAYKAIREKIITGEFTPGLRLKEEFLVNMLGISKTPIKLGIAKLEQDGLVKSVPRRGSYVIEMSPEDIIEVFSLRGVLEGLAASLALKNISEHKINALDRIQQQMNADIGNLSIGSYVENDAKFHNLIIETSGHKMLRECLNPILNKIEMLKYRSASSIERRKEACQDHLAIVAAFREKNKVHAERAMRLHLQKSMKAVVGNITDR